LRKNNFSGMRFLGASQYFGYCKLLRLANVDDSALGKLVTFCSGDMERIFEGIVLFPIICVTPLMFVLSLFYSWMLVGPWSLLGCVVVMLFYPIMVRECITFLLYIWSLL